MDYNQAKNALSEICMESGSGDEKEVKKILDYHNNTNLINEDLNGNGDTILILASDYNNIKIIKLLLSYNNININIKDDVGNTALHYSSLKGNKDIIKLLLSHPNIDINIKNKDGKLASDICCDGFDADKSNKAIILELFENHSKAKTSLTSSPPVHPNTASSTNVIDQSHDSNLKSFEAVEQKESHFQRESTITPTIKLPLPPYKQTHVFLTHTWREDEEGRNNHDRVGRVNEALKKRGLVTWFDSERMKGTVRQAMTDALDATCCVLIFITKKYEEKVNSKNEADNCYFEFNVAAHDPSLANMRIPIVMEECMLNARGWQGRLKAEVGHQLYFDLSGDEEVLEEGYDKVVGRVVELLTERYPEVSIGENLQSSSPPYVAKKSGDVNDQNNNRKGKDSSSFSVQWYEKFGFNENIVSECRKFGIDGEEDLYAVFANDQLYEELRSKLRRLDQNKIEVTRQNLSS